MKEKQTGSRTWGQTGPQFWLLEYLGQAKREREKNEGERLRRRLGWKGQSRGKQHRPIERARKEGGTQLGLEAWAELGC